MSLFGAKAGKLLVGVGSFADRLHGEAVSHDDMKYQ